jgi:hypothetical protein
MIGQFLFHFLLRSPRRKRQPGKVDELAAIGFLGKPKGESRNIHHGKFYPEKPSLGYQNTAGF